MKSQRFSFSKVLLTLMLFVVSALVLVACGDSDQDLVDEALNNVAITYGSGDSQNSVTKNLTLPQSIGEVEVTWTSGNPSVISNAGVVTRPASDTEVTLTATLTLGEAEETMQIKVKVKADDSVDPLDALEALTITGDDVELVGSVYETTSNIVLPTTSMGLTVTWTTANANYVAADGTVTRPNFGIADQVVVLTATIDGEEAQFLIKVLAYTEKQTSQILDEAKTALLIDGISGGTAVDLELPATVGTEGVTVTWESSDDTLIDENGIVYRPSKAEGDQTVTLTATLSKDDQTVTKEFDVLVLAFIEDPVLYNSIGEALSGAKVKDYIRLEGVTVLGITADTYLFTDGTDILAAYMNSVPKVEVGKVYDIYGLFDVYNGAPQLNGDSDNAYPTVAQPSDAAVSTITPKVVTDIDAYIQDAQPTYSASNLFEYEYITLTARVRVQAADNYSTFFVDPDYAGGNVDSSANSPHTTDAIMIYYRSNKAAFNIYDGQVVTFNAFLFSYRSDRNIYTVVFTEEDEDVVFSPTDQEVVDMAETEIKGMFEYEYIEDETLEFLDESKFGATITWESDSTSVNLTTGALTMPTTQETIVLTATIEFENETKVVEITIKAGPLPNSTIAEAIALDVDHLVEITGIVTSAEYQNTYFIQDETGGIAIYSFDTDVETFLQTNYGKEVTIIGTRAVYSGLIQISDIYSTELVGNATLPTAVNVDEHGLDATALASFQGQLVELTGLIVTEVDTDTYDNVYITLLDAVSEESITLKWDSRVDLDTAAAALLDGITAGDVLDIINPLAWSGSNPFLYFTDTTEIAEGVLTDEAAVAATKAALEVEADEPILANETLVLAEDNFGTTITWSSSHPAIISNAGVVTYTADMKQVTVTLTATITKEAITATKTFEILVGEVLSVEQAIETAEDAVIKVQGIVTSDEYFRVFFIQDSTGGIAIYLPFYDDETPSDYVSDFVANIGKEVIITGTRASYEGMRQIILAEDGFKALTTGSAPAATNLDEVALTKEAMDEYQGLLVELTNLYVSNVYVNDYGTMELTLMRPSQTGNIKLRFDSRAILSSAAQTAIEAVEVGDVISVTANLAWYSNPQLYYTNSTIIATGTLEDVDAIALDKLEVEMPELIEETPTEALDLSTTGTNGSTIEWSSSHEAIINSTSGVVTLPEEGQVEVTLTATFTKGTAEVEVDYVVLVGKYVSGASDLFISEYIEGTGSNKAIEIYNGTGADVDLTDYSVALYVNGVSTATSTLALDGTLNNGTSYVIYLTGADAAIIAEGDKEDAVVGFSGTDDFALLKSGAIIDFLDASVVSLADKTLVRAETVSAPNTTFTETEWEVEAVDTFTYLGSHTMIKQTVSYTETFETDLGSSYVDGTFTGVNDIVWTYVEARNEGDYAIDGTGIMLRRDDEPSSLQATFSDGLISIAFEYKKAFTGATERLYKIDITNNGITSTYDLDGFGSGSGAQETVYTYNLDGLNLQGETTVKIYAAAGAQATFDNFTWEQ